MHILVKAKTRAKQESIERVGQPTLGFEDGKKEMPVYKVAVKEPPVAGKANEAIRRMLAEYFEVATGKVRLVTGQTSKQKIFEIAK